MAQAIIIKDKKQCKEVMDKLYEGGCSWASGEPKYDYLEHPYWREVDGTFIRYLGNGKSVYDSLNYALNNGFEVVTADQFLSNPTIIKAWKEPKPEKMITVKGKEYSESTLHEMIVDYSK
jgi:hypothetical protein